MARARSLSARIRGTTRVVVAAGALAVGCQGMCGGGDKKGKGGEKEGSSATVELLNHGKEPRVSMQIGRWTGFRYAVVIETDTSLAIQGQKPVTAPTAVTKLRFHTTRGTADPIERQRGNELLKLVEEVAVIDSVEVVSDKLPAGWLKQVNEGLSIAAGTETRQLVAEDGEIVEVQTKRIGGVEPAPEVKKLLDQAWDGTARFPFRLAPAPVGVGAKWRFSERIKSNGLDIVQVSDMLVRTIDEDQVTITIRAQQQAPAQEFADPFRPGKMAHLDRYQGTGQGQLTIDRTTGVPIVSKFSTSATMTVSIKAEQGKQSMTLLASSVVRMKSVSGDDAGPELLENTSFEDAGLGVLVADAAAASKPSAAPPGSAPPKASAPPPAKKAPK